MSIGFIRTLSDPPTTSLTPSVEPASGNTDISFSEVPTRSDVAVPYDFCSQTQQRECGNPSRSNSPACDGAPHPRLKFNLNVLANVISQVSLFAATRRNTTPKKRKKKQKTKRLHGRYHTVGTVVDLQSSRLLLRDQGTGCLGKLSTETLRVLGTGDPQVRSDEKV